MSIEQIKKRHREAGRATAHLDGVAKIWLVAYLNDVAFLLQELEGCNQQLVLSGEVQKKCQFEEFWSRYPRKEKKKDALAIWKRKRLDAIAERILADVSNRLVRHKNWLDGFIPHPTTYLNGERWNDEIVEVKNGSAKPTSFDTAIDSLKRHRPV